MNRTLHTCVLFLSVLASVHAALGGAATRSVLAPTSTILELDALIEPFADVNVGAQVDGVLSEVLVKRGDTVEVGQVIARLVADLEEAQLEIVTARAKSTAAVDSAAAAVKLSRQRLNRTRKLYEERVASRGALDEVETELQLAELRLREAQENQSMAQLEVKRAAALLQQRTVLAPISGVVVERFLEVGELVYRANRDQILRIAQINPLLVEIIAPLAVHGQVKAGDTVQILPAEPVGGSFEARVLVVDSVIDAASGTIGIRCELPNAKREIPAGLRCRVRLTLAGGR